jgi:hypothetical protein
MVRLFVNAILKLSFIRTVVISVERTSVAFFMVVSFVFNIRINLGDAFFFTIQANDNCFGAIDPNSSLSFHDSLR